MESINIPYKEYIITTDRSLLQETAVFNWLVNESYWAKNLDAATFSIAYKHSFIIGILHYNQQIGFARLTTDYAIFGYLSDVYIIEAHRGKGLATAMLQTLLAIDWVSNLRRIMLSTLDAHSVYLQLGFQAPKFPAKLMELVKKPKE